MHIIYTIHTKQTIGTLFCNISATRSEMVPQSFMISKKEPGVGAGEHSFMNVPPNWEMPLVIISVKFLCTQKKLYCIYTMTAANDSHVRRHTWLVWQYIQHPLAAHRPFHRNNNGVKGKALVTQLPVISAVCSIRSIKLKFWVPLIIRGNSNIPSGELFSVYQLAWG